VLDSTLNVSKGKNMLSYLLSNRNYVDLVGETIAKALERDFKRGFYTIEYLAKWPKDIHKYGSIAIFGEILNPRNALDGKRIYYKRPMPLIESIQRHNTRQNIFYFSPFAYSGNGMRAYVKVYIPTDDIYWTYKIVRA